MSCRGLLPENTGKKPIKIIRAETNFAKNLFLRFSMTAVFPRTPLITDWSASLVTAVHTQQLRTPSWAPSAQTLQEPDICSSGSPAIVRKSIFYPFCPSFAGDMASVICICTTTPSTPTEDRYPFAYTGKPITLHVGAVSNCV